MSFDRHAHFDVLGDVPAGVAGTIGVVDRDRDTDFLCLELVTLYEASVDGAASAAAI